MTKQQTGYHKRKRVIAHWRDRAGPMLFVLIDAEPLGNHQ
jgi:hypothetical protein